MVLCKINITSYIGEGNVIAYLCVFSNEFMPIGICGSMQGLFVTTLVWDLLRVFLVACYFESLTWLDYR